MLTNTLWGVASSLMGIFFAGIQVMVPCLPPAPLSNDVINTDKYLGSWYFVTASAWDEDDLQSHKAIDSSLIHIQKGLNDTLTVTELTRLGEECRKNTWSYYVMGPFVYRNDYDTIALIWDGKFINCPSCIVLLFVDENEEARVSLFSRNEKTPDEVIQDFKSKMECVYTEDFFTAPLKNGYCKLDGAA